MRTLIVDDDFPTRKLLNAYLSPYGACDQVVDGDEAVEAVGLALEEEEPYQLVCLDIMMPNKDGQAVLREIRAMEERYGIHGRRGVPIIMITALGDAENIMEAFKSQCEGYITKPIEREALLEKLRSLNLIT
jgi:two-component system chemotaxis response regulator CheY